MTDRVRVTAWVVRALVDALSGASAPGRVTGVEVALATAAAPGDDPAGFLPG